MDPTLAASAGGGTILNGENIVIMSKKATWLLGSTILVLVTSGTPAVAAKLDGSQYLKDAKVTLADARATALKTYDGKIVGEELEKEAGGSGLRYSFDIDKHGITHEVGVDAKSGKVLENSVEGANSD